MKKDELIKLSNEKLLKILGEVNWCDKDLVNEYDERYLDGRIKFGDPISPDKIQERIHEIYSEKRRRKKAS